MRILEKGERIGTCNKCNTVFAYTEDDFRQNHIERNTHGFLLNYRYLKCPCCKTEIRESQQCLQETKCKSVDVY